MAVSNITRARSTVVSSLSSISFSTRHCNSLTRGWRGLISSASSESNRLSDKEGERGEGEREKDQGGGRQQLGHYSMIWSHVAACRGIAKYLTLGACARVTVLALSFVHSFIHSVQ